MYQSNSSPFVGLVAVILVLVVIGSLVGLALSQSDITNFITNKAKAEGILQQNDYQAQKNSIDLKNYQSVQDSVTQDQKERIAADGLAYQKSLAQQLQLQNAQAEQRIRLEAEKASLDLEMSRLVTYALIGAGVLLALCIGAGAVIFAIQSGRKRIILTQIKVNPVERWEDPFWRKREIERSRQREQVNRRVGTHNGTPEETSTIIPFSEEPIIWEDLDHAGYVTIQS